MWTQVRIEVPNPRLFEGGGVSQVALELWCGSHEYESDTVLAQLN